MEHSDIKTTEFRLSADHSHACNGHMQSGGYFENSPKKIYTFETFWKKTVPHQNFRTKNFTPPKFQGKSVPRNINLQTAGGH